MQGRMPRWELRIPKIKSKVLRPWQTRTHCCGHMVAQCCFLGCANWETFVADTKCFWTKSETFFCVPDTKFVSATNVARAGKRGNICVGNNVSSFARAFNFRTQVWFQSTTETLAEFLKICNNCMPAMVFFCLMCWGLTALERQRGIQWENIVPELFFRPCGRIELT